MAQAKTQTSENTPKRPDFRLTVARFNPKTKQSDLIEVAAFWERKSQAGKTMYSGKVKENFTLEKDEWLNIFPNQ